MTDKISEQTYRDGVLLDDLYPAPNDWNFYGELSPSKMKELIESILSVGILHPIVVWEHPNKETGKKYMILSGHNRFKAYTLLRENDNQKKYSRIDAIIKGSTEITDEMAKEIIIDTNWVQRELTPIQRAKSISKKYIQMKHKFNTQKVNVNEIISKEYNLSERQIINYKILSNLLREIQNYVDDGSISIKAGVQIAKLSIEIQTFLFDNYISKNKCRLINSNYSKFKNITTKEEFEELLKTDKDKPIGKIEIRYLDLNDETIIKSSCITYPKEDEKYFKNLVESFCDEIDDRNIDDCEYSKGDFFFTIVK